MKIADKGPANVHILQPTRREQGAAQVSISAKIHQLQLVAALAERSDELQAEKVKWLKKQIEQGTYHVEAADVAKGIIWSATSRLLGKSCCTPSPS